MCAGRRSSPGPHHMLFCSNQSHHSCRSSSGRRSTRRIGAPSPPTSRCARIRNQNLYTMTASRSPRSNFLVSLSCCNTHSAAPRAVRRNPERSTAGACPLLTCDSSPHGVSDAMHRSWRPTRSMWSGRTSLTSTSGPPAPPPTSAPLGTRKRSNEADGSWFTRKDELDCQRAARQPRRRGVRPSHP